MVNLGLIKALIESSELSEITTITSITTSDNKIIFNTESGSYTVTIPEPVLGVDKIDIENKNLKITYNDGTTEILDLSFLKGDKGDLGIIGDNLITYNATNPSDIYGGEWILDGISGSATTDNLLIDFYENGRINYNYSITTTENHVILEYPFQLASTPFATGTGVLNSKSVNIIGIKTISDTSIEVNIPSAGRGCLSVQGLYKNIGTSGIGNLDINKLTEMRASIKYHWRKVNND